MIFCYLDESGQTGNKLDDPRQPIFVLGGVLVPEEKWKDVDRALRALAEKVTEDVLAATTTAYLERETRSLRFWTKTVFKREKKLWAELTVDEEANLPREIRNHVDRHGPVELHGIDLFQGDRMLRCLGKTKQVAVATSMMDIVDAHELNFLCVKIDKMKHAARYSSPDPPYALSLMFMCEMLHAEASRANHRGLLIADYVEGDLLKHKRDIAAYQTVGTHYLKRNIDSVVDSIHFTDSACAPCIQLADVCTYLAAHEATKKPPRADLAPLIARLNKRTAGTKVFP